MKQGVRQPRVHVPQSRARQNGGRRVKRAGGNAGRKLPPGQKEALAPRKAQAHHESRSKRHPQKHRAENAHPNGIGFSDEDGREPEQGRRYRRTGDALRLRRPPRTPQRTDHPAPRLSAQTPTCRCAPKHTALRGFGQPRARLEPQRARSRSRPACRVGGDAVRAASRQTTGLLHHLAPSMVQPTMASPRYSARNPIVSRIMSITARQ